MHPRLQALGETLSFSGRVALDAPAFLSHHGAPHTAAHVADVAREARRLADLTGADADSAETGGWLHDISNIIPNGERIAVARDLGVHVLPEEEAFPMIIHQKLSVEVARGLFGVADPAILSAIGCHTTLKAPATLLDKVVFLADKIAWDQPGQPPYRAALLNALDTQGIDAGCLVYLNYLWDMRDKLRVVHPWMVAARAMLLA